MGICLSVEGTGDTPEDIEPFDGSIGRCRFDCGGDSQVHRAPDVERASTDASLGDTTEAAEKFGPLIVALEAIRVVCGDNEVRQQLPFHKAPLTNKFQRSIAVRNKIKVLLPHVVGLEKCFDSSPGDVRELNRREGLTRYAIIPLPCAVLTSS